MKLEDVYQLYLNPVIYMFGKMVKSLHSMTGAILSRKN